VEVEPEFLAHWKLDETGGKVAADSSGAGIAGKLLDSKSKGGPTWTNVAGRAGLYFNGMDNVVDTGTRLEDLRLPFSIAFWVNPAATQVEFADILGNHANNFGLVMQQDGNKTNLFAFGYSGGGPGAVQLTAGEWQHLAVVCDGEKAVCYLNGAEKCSAPAKGALAPNPNLTFRLGQGYKEGRFFRGLLGDVRIYRKALSAAEVRSLAADEAPKAGESSDSARRGGN
jgi:hypothetical protein